jgi:hypothetical protein
MSAVGTIIVVIIIILVIFVLLGIWRRRGQKDDSRRESSDKSKKSSDSGSNERSSHSYQEHHGRSKKVHAGNPAAQPAEKQEDFPRNLAHSGRRRVQTDQTTDQTGQDEHQFGDQNNRKDKKTDQEQQVLNRHQESHHRHHRVTVQPTDEQQTDEDQYGNQNNRKKNNDQSQQVLNHREIHHQERHQVESSDNTERIYVKSMAELFSPKENIQAEYGVSEQQLAEMVSTFKKGKEYKERKLPINRHFDMNKYEQANQTIRESSIPQKGHGSKKGTIVGSIYRKYGKNFTNQSVHGQNRGDIMASITQQEQHERVVRNTQGKSSRGILIDKK